jgi:hypothetical protein
MTRLSFYCSFVRLDYINFANNSQGKQREALLCCLTSEKISFRERISFQPPCNVSEFGLCSRSSAHPLREAL